MDRSKADLTGVASPSEVGFIKIKEVLAICRISRSAVYKAVKTGDFPAPVKLSVRSSAWVKGEVLQWVDACIKASRSK